MSAKGQQQTSASRSQMSALPPKADMFSAEIDVSDGPPGPKDWLKRAHYVPALGFEAS